MQAGGARGAVGEAGGWLRCHPASSGCPVAGTLHAGHLEGSRGPSGNRAPTPGRGPGAAGPPRLGGWAPTLCFPLPAARRPLADSRGRPGGGAEQSRARIPRSSAPGRLGDAQPSLQLAGLPGALSGPIWIPPKSSNPLPRQLRCPALSFQALLLLLLRKPRGDLRASQHPDSDHFL